jgi:predicted transcriptional regulator
LIEVLVIIYQGRAVLLSVKPRFAHQILSGSKQVEFRRVWPRTAVGIVLLYASAPTQRLVGTVHVKRSVETGPDELWDLAMQYGGGVTKDELLMYVGERKTAFAIIIDSVEVPLASIDPIAIFPGFRPPMSYRYLSPQEFSAAHSQLFPGRS